MHIVVMGVSGSGKSTVGAALAARLGVEFEDGDDLHPPANIAKMSAGIPLTDEDRWPWLDAVGDWLAARPAGVVACSALRRVYRDRVRAHAPATYVVHLAGTQELIAARQAARPGHFMPASLLGSQFATLEQLDADEAGITLDVALSVDELVDRAARAAQDEVAR